MTCIKFEVPIKAPSLTNQREHYSSLHRQKSRQRDATRRRWPGWDGGPLLVVRLTRVAPRALDSDNLAASLKSVRDEVCACLRVDDATPLVRWEYRQEKGPEVVRVEVAWGDAPAAVVGQVLHALTVRADALLAANATQVALPPPVPALEASRAMATPPRPPESISEDRPRRVRKAPAELRALATSNTYPAAHPKKETKR
ncbi:hypothetical protein Mx8p24 [Myxococcus phage Mx8]|uniref:p24 n=1 Tax=Myxococcus phage Mx8 TaxID=49964 RepID=Q94MU5_9CAUD|nr:hypothetical protein Mx8p24 [Myxococcus phage Mx8]AAK94359.1 p24 [Myxococcus phage Mx8]